MANEVIQQLKQYGPQAFSVLTLCVGAILGHWLGGARETAKARRIHKRDVRAIQSAYDPTRHPEFTMRLDAWWPQAIDDYGRFARWRLGKLRQQLRAIQTPEPGYDQNCQSTYTEALGAEYDKRLQQTREKAMQVFERFINAL